jgi:hypothetical protein
MTGLDGMPVIIGVDYDSVTIHAGEFVSGGGIRLGLSVQVDEFTSLFVAGCWQAAAQIALMDEADRA